MAGDVSTFLMQNLWWAFGVPDERMAFNAPGLWTQMRKRRYRRLDRPFHLGLLAAGFKFTNIIELNAFWLNERLTNCRVSIDPDPATVDFLWVYSQDPLPAERRKRIEDAIARAPHGTPVINPPDVFDAYHQGDLFERLAAAGVHVPRSRFGPEDRGVPVIFKPEGKHSKVLGPQPWEGEMHGYRGFEYFDARGADGLHRRYRATYVLGRVFAECCFAGRVPIVRARNGKTELDWLLSEDEVDQVKRIGATTGLDFFTVDFLRPSASPRSVFTDINSFPMMKLLEPPGYPVRYGHRHNFDIARPSDSDGLTPWLWLDRVFSETGRGLS